MDLPPGSHSDHRRQQADRNVVFESQLEEQSVGQFQPLYRCQQRLPLFASQDPGIRRISGRILELLEVDLSRDQVSQVPTRNPVDGSATSGMLLRVGSAMRPTVVVDAQATCDDYQPGRELSPALSSEDSQATEIILPELIQDVGVMVHRPVMACGVSASYLEKESAVIIREACPRTAAGTVVRCLQQSRELRWDRCGHVETAGIRYGARLGCCIEYRILRA